MPAPTADRILLQPSPGKEELQNATVSPISFLMLPIVASPHQNHHHVTRRILLLTSETHCAANAKRRRSTTMTAMTANIHPLPNVQNAVQQRLPLSQFKQPLSYFQLLFHTMIYSTCNITTVSPTTKCAVSPLLFVDLHTFLD